MVRVETVEAAREAHQASGERLAHTLGHIFRLVVIAVVAALAVRTFLIQPFSIPSRSMAPLLDAGDYLFVDKTAYGWSRASLPFRFPDEGIPDTSSRTQTRIMGKKPEAGDVIVFVSPGRPSSDYVKRVIARGGERVALVDGRVILNGLELSCAPMGENLCQERLPNGVSYPVVQDSGSALANYGEIYVPEDYMFVLGDNRGDSIDSRVSQAMGGIGLVHESQIIGQGARIFFSLGNSDNFIRWNRIGQAVR